MSFSHKAAFFRKKREESNYHENNFNHVCVFACVCLCFANLVFLESLFQFFQNATEKSVVHKNVILWKRFEGKQAILSRRFNFLEM